MLNRGLDEIAQAGVGHDVLKAGGCISFLAQAQDGAVQEDVLPAGELGVKAGPQLDEARSPGRARVTVALVGLVDAGQDLQQGRLARAVLAR